MPRRVATTTALSLAFLLVACGTTARTDSSSPSLTPSPARAATATGAATPAAEQSSDTPAPRPADATTARPSASAAERAPDVITPDADEATTDKPALYSDPGCYARARGSEVLRCDYGDPDGDLTVALVGDSKAMQWMTPLSAIARDNGWQLHVYGKSGCTFVDAMTLLDGEPYTACHDWSLGVLERFSETGHPDVLVTSAIGSRALDADGEPERAALIAGYVQTWDRLAEHDVRVLALSDTPHPRALGEDVYECVDAGEDPATDCTWPYERSGSSAGLRAAAERAKDATFVDLDPWICPRDICRGVVDGILTYRDGSHITDTYARSLETPLAERLVPLVDDRSG